MINYRDQTSIPLLEGPSESLVESEAECIN